MFNFSSDDVNKLRGYLHNTISSVDNELEVRFSTYVRSDIFPERTPADPNHKPAQYRFSPVVDMASFHRALDAFHSYNLKTEKVHSQDISFQNYTRQTLFYDDTWSKVTGEQWMKKNRSKYHDIWDANMRISLATEVPCEALNPRINRPEQKRVKERTSFYDKGIRYDFTIVHTTQFSSTKEPAKTSYEIEIEVIEHRNGKNISPEQIPVNDIANHIISGSLHMLCLLQDSPAIITLSEKHNVILEYCVLTQMGNTGKPRFIGAQPETLHKHHLSKVHSGGLSITEKYDGERFLLFIADVGYGFLLDRSLMRIKHTGLVNTKNKGTILDVEYVAGAIYAFDICFHNGVDLRSDRNMDLKRRLELMKAVVLNLEKENSTRTDCIPIFVKEHYFDDFATVYQRFMNNEYTDGIARDGFIFTPLAEPYPNKPKWATLLKWKPPELNSIDFYVKVASGTPDYQEWELFVGEERAKVPFIEKPVVRVPIRELISLINGSQDVSTVFDGRIVECTWNEKESRFTPLRLRFDKTNPNYKHVAQDVWESIQTPVHLDDLQKSPFQNMRKFHNLVKSHTINVAVEKRLATIATKAVNVKKSWADMDDDEMDDEVEYMNPLSTTMNVLDLACGRGGDLWKWAQQTKKGQSSSSLSIQYVGVDLDENLLSEAKNRYTEMQRQFPRVQCQWEKCDLRHQSPKWRRDGNSFDIISCQFALHYFYENEATFSNFIKIVKENLATRGVFICTLFDGYAVWDLLLKGYNKQNIGASGFDITALFDTRLGLENVKAKEFSIPITAVLNGDDDVILHEPRTEYLVFADLFIKRMMNEGFALVECHRFGDFKVSEKLPLTETEESYSQLHRYYVFQYHPDKIVDKEFIRLEEICTTFPTSSDIENHPCFNISSEDADKAKGSLFVRMCGGEKNEFCKLGKYHCLLTTLEMISGKTVSEKEMKRDDWNMDDIAEHYNMFLSVIPTVKKPPFIEPKWDAYSLHKPVNYLPDVKMVSILDGDDHFHILGYQCPETGTKLLVFPAPVESSSTSSHVASSNDESSVAEPEGMKEEVEKGVNIVEPIEPVEIIEAAAEFTGTVKDLLSIAKSRGVKVPAASRKKQDLLNVLTEKLGARFWNENREDVAVGSSTHV
jgi:hypothetical protein